LPNLHSWFQVTGPAGLWWLAAGSFVVALSGALMPGPLLVAAIREGVRQGARAGPLLTLGHGILEAAVVVLVYLGAGGFLKRPGPFAVVALAGGAALLVMGALMLRGARKATMAGPTGAAAPEESSGGAAGLGRTVLAGAGVSLSNPYWSLWWVTVGMGYLASAAAWGWPGLGVFFAGHILADLAWYWLVTAAVARGRKLLSDRGYRALIVGCGLFLVGFAGQFLGAGLGGLSTFF